jgi:hypothetical protein
MNIYKATYVVPQQIPDQPKGKVRLVQQEVTYLAEDWIPVFNAARERVGQGAQLMALQLLAAVQEDLTGAELKLV